MPSCASPSDPSARVPKKKAPGCPGALAVGRPVSRVLSITPLRFTALRLPSRSGVNGRSSLWAAASPRGSCSLPGARRGRAAPWIPEGTVAPAWPCSRRGLPGRGHCWPRRWSLTPPFHPDPGSRRGGLFLWPCPRVAPPGDYPAPCSVERGLSSAGRAGRDRPAHPHPLPSYPDFCARFGRPKPGFGSPYRTSEVGFR